VPQVRDVSLRQLRSLAAVVEAGTLAGAADALHVTPPAVGQQLKALTRQVGMPLITKTQDGYAPTDAGHELLKAADRIEFELSTCMEAIELLRSGKRGSAVLGAVSTAKYFAPSLLAAFWREHPDLDVKLVIGNRREIISALSEHEVDMAVMGRPPDDVPLDVTVIGDHPHVIITAPDHPLRSRRITKRTLARERFLVREDGSGTRILTEQVFASMAARPTVVMEISSNETIKQAVMAGLGVALISGHTVAAELADGRLGALEVEGFPITRQWFGVRRSGGHVLPACEALWHFLGVEAGGHLPRLD
jgi:DNA-binding transcriptional LysR family regulator